MKAELPIREQDRWGAGHFGASRGRRLHQGIDYACPVHAGIYPRVPGVVTRLGHPYADDPETRINELLAYDYVQVTDDLGYDHRYFYVDPCVAVGEVVGTGDIIGHVQDLTKIYPGITTHCHYEVKLNGAYVNPEDL